jgi:hypothetical protein
MKEALPAQAADAHTHPVIGAKNLLWLRNETYSREGRGACTPIENFFGCVFGTVRFFIGHG